MNDTEFFNMKYFSCLYCIFLTHVQLRNLAGLVEQSIVYLPFILSYVKLFIVKTVTIYRIQDFKKFSVKQDV